MNPKWKIFKVSFPYICNNCGEFSSSQREFCEVCGRKNSLRRIEKQDYERTIENSKLNETYNKTKKRLQKDKNSRWSKKKKKGLYMILIVSSVILIIDVIAFFIILNLLNIPLEEIGDNLWVLFILLGFSIVVLILIFIAIYFTYFTGKYLWWLPIR